MSSLFQNTLQKLKPYKATNRHWRLTDAGFKVGSDVDHDIYYEDNIHSALVWDHESTTYGKHVKIKFEDKISHADCV